MSSIAVSTASFGVNDRVSTSVQHRPNRVGTSLMQHKSLSVHIQAVQRSCALHFLTLLCDLALQQKNLGVERAEMVDGLQRDLHPMSMPSLAS